MPSLPNSSTHLRAARCRSSPAPIAITTSPWLRLGDDRLRHRADLVDEHRLDLAGDAQRARERTAVGGDDRRLAGGIDLGEQHRVGAADAP